MVSSEAARRALAWAGAPLVALAVHARALSFGFTHLDDVDLVNGARRGGLFAAFGRSYFFAVDPEHAYYRPLVTVSYAIDGGHATNVALHALASLLVCALFRRLEFSPRAAAAGSTFFAVSPALASVAAWIPGRNDSLALVFALGSFLLFAWPRTERHLAAKLAHGALFLAALLTKEVAAMLPLACGLYAALFGRSLRRVWPWVAWGLAFAMYAFARSRAVHGALDPSNVMRNARVLVTGVGKLVLPVNLSVIPIAEDTLLWPGVVVVLALLLLGWRLASARRRVLLFGAGWYALFSLPAFLTPGVLALECRLYLPAAGLAVIAIELARSVPVSPHALASFAAASLAAFAFLSLGHASAYRDRTAFGAAAVAGSPHSALAHSILGQAHHVAGREGAALSEYAAALALDSSEPIVRNNIAVIHMAHARWLDAERELRAELEISPHYAVAHSNLGKVLRRQGRLEEAARSFEAARELDPSLAAP